MCEEADIVEELGGFGLRIDEEKALSKMRDIGLKLNIESSSLAEKYVAFQRNHKFSENVSLKNAEAFERELSARTESNKAKTKPTPRDNKGVLPLQMIQELMDVETCDKQQNLLSSYVPGVNFEHIVGATQQQLHTKENSPLTVEVEPVPTDSSHLCQYGVNSDEALCANSDFSTNWNVELLTIGKSFSYMNQTLLEKAEILDNYAWKQAKRALKCLPEDDSLLLINHYQVTNFCQPVTTTAEQPQKPDSCQSSSQMNSSSNEARHWQTLVGQLRPTSARLQSLALVAGRIATLVLPPEPGSVGQADFECRQRLQAGNLGLIGLRRVEAAGVPGCLDAVTRMVVVVGGDVDGDGSEVKLTTSGAHSVYTGQPVVLRCANPTGQLLRVAEIFQARVDEPPELTATVPGVDLHLLVACGPYTLSTYSDHDLLLSLLRCVKRHRPHVLFLLGPFVDARQPAVESYSETGFDELFQLRVDMVAEYCSHLGVQLVLLPSSHDVHHDPIYPTPPFSQDWTVGNPSLVARYQKVLFAWDPSLVRIGSYVFGVTATDALLHLSGEEISIGSSSGDRISRLCRHLLASGTFYPVHPPADDLPVDYPLWEEHAQLSVTPHCLITPSCLRPFVKNVDGVVCINPGHVSRGQSAGSYAQILVRGPNPLEAETPSPARSIADRSSVLVHRL